jgi:hypothetical protein
MKKVGVASAALRHVGVAASATVLWKGGQTGQIFAYWAIAYFWLFFRK